VKHLKFAYLQLILSVVVLWDEIQRALGTPPLPIANIGEGTHDGTITKLATAAVTVRYGLVKVGADADHFAVAGTADIPWGVCVDEPTAAEMPAAIDILGCRDRTVLMVASAAIAAGAYVVAASSNGKIRTLPGTTGTYYIVGMALNAASADGDLVEVAHCIPVQRVVP